MLILAAITASFVGARRRLRRPVLLGGLAGIAATAVTWGLAQLLVSELGTGGLRLEAITGLLAIAVLLVVTNWFFHRVYWSQWIARFNRRRKRLEGVGFLSGQALGLGILGLTSVYREGFETVLFVQNLEVSAGAARVPARRRRSGSPRRSRVGGVTFVAQRKLPYRRMLIATGVLIALVLAVMTGTTVHVMQGLGWLPQLADRLHRPAVGQPLARDLRAPGRASRASSARSCSWSAPMSSRASCRARGAARTASPRRASRQIDGPRRTIHGPPAGGRADRLSAHNGRRVESLRACPSMRI